MWVGTQGMTKNAHKFRIKMTTIWRAFPVVIACSPYRFNLKCGVRFINNPPHFLRSSSQFLGVFAKWRKATISFVMTVRPSVLMDQLDSHWTDFHQIWCLRIFRKSVEKIQVSLHSGKNKGYFPWWPIDIFLSYKARSKNDWTFAIKILLLILQHFKHCPLQSSLLYWRYTVLIISSIQSAYQLMYSLNFILKRF